jgi:membrane protease YdiL (CAAX protease family)
VHLVNVFGALPWPLKCAVGLALVFAGALVLRRRWRQPVPFTIGATLLDVGTMIALRGLTYAVPSSGWRIAVSLLVVALPLAAAIAFLAWRRAFRQAGFTPIRQWRSRHLLFILPLTLLLPAFALSAGIRVMSTATVIFYGIYILLAVTQEETIYRGLILSALRPYSPIYAALLSSGLFAISHLNNIFLVGKSATATLEQILLAGFLGVFFAAIRLRMNAIWPVIVAHGSYDFLLSLVRGITATTRDPRPGSIIGLAFVGLYVVLGVFLLRKRAWRAESDGITTEAGVFAPGRSPFSG